MKRRVDQFLSTAIAVMAMFVAGVTIACNEGATASAEAEVPEIDTETALGTCAAGAEPVSLGTPRELPLGGTVTVHAFENELPYEMQGTEMFGAIADVEVCAGDQVSLDTPFTNPGSFSLCMSEVWEGESSTNAYPPMMTPMLREPVLPPASETIPRGECRRGWVSFQAGEEGYPLPQTHAIIYDTSPFSDYAEDQVLFAWTLD